MCPYFGNKSIRIGNKSFFAPVNVLTLVMMTQFWLLIYTERTKSVTHLNPEHQHESYLDTDLSTKQKFTSIKEEINALKLQEVNKKKSQKLLASRAGSSKQTKAGKRLRNPLLKLNE